MATKYAMRNARRHMVHVPTYEGGQLYHDLIGQKNNCEIIIRASNAATDTIRTHRQRVAPNTTPPSFPFPSSQHHRGWLKRVLLSFARCWI